MNEQEYKEQWSIAGSPQKIAEVGGSLATTPGQIFIAGYQAAIRQTFEELLDDCWYSFAVTEDRKSQPPRPGLSVSNNRVTGFKTWIAAAACIDKIVVKVGSGQKAIYGVVEKDASVDITLREGRFLSDMSQGMAEFRASVLMPLDASKVAGFRVFEPQFIYLAFLSHVAKKDWPISTQAQQALVSEPTLKALDTIVNELVDAMTTHDLSIGQNWAVDQRLFTMYSEGIQATAQ